MEKVLFVCLGNICRSPMADGLLKHKLSERGLPYQGVDSCGTSAVHAGEDADPRTLEVLARHGIHFPQVSRQVRPSDFDRFDLIIGMDADNLARIEALRPEGNGTPVAVFTDYAPQAGVDHVPDPYYTRDFDQTLDLVEQASRGLIAALDA